MKLLKISDKNEIRKYISLLYSELFDDKAIPSTEQFDSILSQLNEQSAEHDAYCLQENNETLAFFTLCESFAIFANGKYGIINELWVNKNCRSKGVGKQVLKEIVKIASEKSWNRIDVSAPVSEKWDRTFNFYQNNEFIYTGRKLKLNL